MEWNRFSTESNDEYEYENDGYENDEHEKANEAKAEDDELES